MVAIFGIFKWVCIVQYIFILTLLFIIIKAAQVLSKDSVKKCWLKLCLYGNSNSKCDYFDNLSLVFRLSHGCHQKLCKDMQCTTLEIIPPQWGRSHDLVRCNITDWIFNGAMYDLNVTGRNPFANGSQIFTTALESKICEHC